MLLVLAGALALALTNGLPGTGSSRAAAQPASVEPTPQTDDSVPAHNVTMIGASPSEAPDETWGIGESGEGAGASAVLVRYSTETGWSLGPGLLNSAGQPLAGFKLDQPEGSPGPSPLAGQLTADGAGMMVGTVPAEGNAVSPVVLVRNPGNPANPFQETATVPAEDLGAEESLLGAKRAPLIAPLEESSGHAGALIVPVDEHGAGVEDAVLHWDGSAWTREPIEVPALSKTDFRVLALGASSPANAWLLAQLSSNYPAGAVALFRRHSGEGGEAPSWRPVWLGSGAVPKEADPLTIPVAGGGEAKPFTVSGTGEPPSVQNQILTVTGEGVWIDGVREDVQASSTMFFKPEGEADSGRMIASWCRLPEGAPAGSPACQHELPEALPTGPSRSIAWANAATPEGLGERVIAGLPDGVSLRLEGEEFKRVLALGGAEAPGDVGGTFGAAFSDPREGWLGQARLPVHLTLNPIPSRLAPWPVSFHHTLVAIAPQPGVPTGALASEAIAVGDQGEVARYEPGKGWLPESLFGPGEKVETPRLRAVAWPTPKRIYAVGDKGEMWLWRAETGLWEKDPATPIDFRGNLLGIAFDPSEPSRGYAVGSPSLANKENSEDEEKEGGALLHYGKTWTQEAFPAEPPCAPKEAGNGEEVKRCKSWADASFTSVAFAGSEAIVAYRVLLARDKNEYRGGLIVNSGSGGWHIDTAAAAAMGANVPWAVAGLPDGGAAFAASGSVYEREGPGAPWQPTPTPFPGGGEPGSLALFREGGALRAIAAGSAPDTYTVDSEPESASGFPPTLLQAYPLGENPERGVIRQTASGWSDEEHELNNVREPPGKYAYYDTVYQPDPVAAVLTDPTGSQGWAIGGFVEPPGESHGGVLDTADVDRYPADGTAPPGVGTSRVSSSPSEATFAIGGNAQCAAPCADRSGARIGPDVWLSAALEHAGKIPGVRAFFYTGPRVTTGETAGPATQPVPYARELNRYAQLLGASPIPAFAAVSPWEFPFKGDEELYEEQFSGFSEPFGAAPALPHLAPAGGPNERASCAATPGCQAGYYALSSSGPAGSVRVIVLDDSAEVGTTQQQWLKVELEEAKDVPEPAIVIGNADLNAQIAAKGTSTAAAEAVARILTAGGASAYFYDSPEENIQEPLAGSGVAPTSTSAGEPPVPTFGSGTLGYVNFTAESSGHFLGASGFLLGQVNFKNWNDKTNFAEVTARLIPNVGELALEAQNGTLLRRSNTALFAALARRPRAGNQARNETNHRTTDPYIPIPSSCVGTECANGIFPEYTFTSSNPDIGGFVEENLAATNPHLTPLQNAKGEPVRDEPRNATGELTRNGQFEVNGKGEEVNEDGEVLQGAQSALFCAYNAGTTIVTINAGGLSSSLPVTVQAGSVREPCGTVPLKHLPAASQTAAAPVPPPAPAPAPAPAGPAPAPAPVPLPPPPAAVIPPAPARLTPTLPPPFFLPPPLTAPVLAFVPPPVPTPARPTPPSGTSAVTSPIEVAEHEDEEESATESVSNQALAYRAPEHEPSPAYILGIVLLAAFAGASTMRRRPRRGRREVRVAPATLTTQRAQRRMSSGGRGRRL